MSGNMDTLKKLGAEAKMAFDDESLACQEESRHTRLQRFLHFWLLVGRSFVRNRCPVRASSLAYASLLALVPILAVVLSVSSSLLKRQGEDTIRRFVDRMVAEVTPDTTRLVVRDPLHPDQMIFVPASPAEETPAPLLAKEVATREDITKRINQFVANTRSGAIGVTGSIMLLFVAISMLSRIEDTFNDIWGVTQGRNWFSRIVLYWAALSLGPILIALALTLTSSPHVSEVRDFVESLPWGAPAVKVLIALLPFLILGLAFSLFYQLMPNTRVHWQAAAAGGFVGGFLWQLNNECSVLYVSRVVSNSRVYGSMGMVPVLMIGLYFSWLILLFGAQVAYAYQNRRTYLQERHAEKVHQKSKEFVALRLAAQVATRFSQAAKPPSLIELSESCGVPTRLAGQILRVLVEMRLLAEVQDLEVCYVPARPLQQITVHDVLQAVRVGKGADLLTRLDPVQALLVEETQKVAIAEFAVASAVTLEGLVEKMAKLSSLPTQGQAGGKG